MSSDRGIVICGGGYKYFTNAWILARLLRQVGCKLPMELWILDRSEIDDRMQTLAEEVGFTIRLPRRGIIGARNGHNLPSGTRWQWALKPYAILHSRFSEVLFLDADSFPTRDPSGLFGSTQYLEHGSLFWPDIRVTGKANPMWEVMDVPFRIEPEFETGQMLIDKRRCWEPLQLALWMNQRADQFYQFLWGDKDTFRFAWHKFGRPFGFIPHPPQPLHFPGSTEIAGLCQHDLDGNWLFQHRNMAKWDLLGINPRIPGYLYEIESRQYLAELRHKWDGRVETRRKRTSEYNRSQYTEMERLRTALITGVWLFEDRRSKPGECCAPPVEWVEQRIPFPWRHEDASVAADQSQKRARYTELRFLSDSIGAGAQKDLYWWAIRPTGAAKIPTLDFSGETGTTMTLRQTNGGVWQGRWKSHVGNEALLARLIPIETAYPENQVRRVERQPHSSQQPIRVANHAYGIGDAVAGLYTITGLVRSGVPVIYHTRHPQWLRRMCEPGLTLTDEPPPAGTCDLNADYAEQLRYANSKSQWYGMFAAAAHPEWKNAIGLDQIAAPPPRSARPSMNRSVHESVLDMEKYVLMAPLAAWPERNWTDTHWRRLSFLLNQTGYEVVAIGTKSDEGQLRQIFDKSNAYWVIDQAAEWITAAMLRAQVVIGVDSGMIHLAGLLGVPSICIHSQLPPKFLFSHAPSVFSVSPQTECVFCRWQEDKGYNEGCASACSALTTVSPEQVMATLRAPKLAALRRKLDKRIKDDTRRYPLSPTVSARIEISQPDIIAYRLPPDSGMGEAAQMNITAFKASGLKVEERLWDRTGISQEADGVSGPIYYHHWHPQPDEADRDWRVVGFRRPSGATHVGYWAYEAEGDVPPPFQMLAPFMTELWTPSTFCQQVFKQTGRPVQVVPHSVPFVERLVELPSKNGKAPYTVLYLFDAWSRFARKNPLAAVRVFQQTFRFRHDVRLVLKGHHLSESELVELRKEGGHDSRITVINQFLSLPELDAVFDRSDVLLSLQRGEGFGLNIARALGRGLPVITTGWGGQLDFCTADNAILVPYRLKSVTEEEGHSFSSGHWAEPDEAAAARLLAKIEAMSTSDDPSLRERRENGRLLIATAFSQAALNQCILNRITALRSTSYAT